MIGECHLLVEDVQLAQISEGEMLVFATTSAKPLLVVFPLPRFRLVTLSSFAFGTTGLEASSRASRLDHPEDMCADVGLL